jgi:hypothetical protein
MKFGPVPIGDAAGAILAHTARLPGGAIKKGTHLSQAELARLTESGYESVIAARLEAGDVGEDKASRAGSTFSPKPVAWHWSMPNGWSHSTTSTMA